MFCMWQNSEYARRSRLSVINCQHMSVCVKWAQYRVKPGGTAGSVYSDPVPALILGQGLLRVSNEPCADGTVPSIQPDMAEWP